MIPALRTRRLVLRPLGLDDAPAIQELFPHWAIVRHLTDVPWPYPPDGALTFLQEIALPAMARGQAWFWSIRPLDAPTRLIGVINLRADTDTHRGFWLGLPWQGRGLMSEACDAVTDFWFGTLGRPLLRVAKAIDNHASRRISVRAGMQLVDTVTATYVAGPCRTEIWELTRAAWLARRPA